MSICHATFLYSPAFHRSLESVSVVRIINHAFSYVPFLQFWCCLKLYVIEAVNVMPPTGYDRPHTTWYTHEHMGHSFSQSPAVIPGNSSSKWFSQWLIGFHLKVGLTVTNMGILTTPSRRISKTGTKLTMHNAHCDFMTRACGLVIS